MGSQEYRYDTSASIALAATMRLYKDISFTQPYLSQPTFSCLGKENCQQRVFIGIELDNADLGIFEKALAD